MAKVLSSISGNLISAASAGFAPTNSADVSAIASAYQVVSATATQLYAGTAYVTSVNDAPISASRAGNASNASLATSAWYDGTGRLISSLPDAATVSAIASSYADGKADASALSSYALSSDVSSTIDTVANNSASWGAGVSLPITGSVGTDSATYGETSVEFTRYDTAGEPDIRTASLSPDALDITYTVDGNDYYSVRITENGVELSDPDGYYSVTPYDITNWNSAVETVSNNSASWGGGAQVVTATGSASATAVTGGFPPIGTSYLVSSINGSAILPYGYDTLSSNSAKWNSTNSAVSSNSAGWTSTNSAVSANSAKWNNASNTVTLKSGGWTAAASAVSSNSAHWNSVYNTVSSNSASWSGSTGGGEISSPSGTIFVNGSQIEGTNSAVLTASSEPGFITSFAAGVQIPSWTSQELYAGNLPGSGATLYIPTNTYLQNTTAFISGRDSNMAIITASGLATEDPITIYLGAIVSNISASANNYIPINGNVTAEKEGGITVTGVGELAWKSAVDNVTNTVASNSATWGQGGVDSATVSSIASSYAQSAVSGKQDSSAMTGYIPTSESSKYYSTSNPAGYITGVDLTNYATTSYVDSSVSSKADSSALSSYALSADVSSTVDTVSAQSANWGGSALALSAGPGVSLTKSGNTLIASTDETVLWSGPSEWVSSVPTIAMSETLSNFERIGIYAAGYANSNQWGYQEIKLSAEDTANGAPFNIQAAAGDYTFARFNVGLIFPRNGGRSLVFDGFKQFNLGATVNIAQSPAKIQKIVGINRTANN